MGEQCPKLCHPMWSNGSLYSQMGDQWPKVCHPLWWHGRTAHSVIIPLWWNVSQNVSPFMIKWENSVPKYVILCSPMGERCPKVYHPLRSNGRAVVLCHDRTLTHCTCLKCFCRFISCFVSWKNRHNLRFNVNLFMLSITCSHHTFALVSALFWILYFQA